MTTDAPKQKEHFPPQGNGPLTRITLPRDPTMEIWGVEGFLTIYGMKLLRTMWVLRRPNNELTCIGSLRLDRVTESELDKLGKVTHVIRTTGGHGVDDSYYASKYGATMWALGGPGSAPSSKWAMPVKYTEFSEDAPLVAALGHDVKVFLVPMGNKVREAVLFFEKAGAILSADFITTSSSSQLVTRLSSLDPGFFSRSMTKMMGFYGVAITSSNWMKLVDAKSKDVLYAFNGRLMDLDWDAILSSHGGPVLAQGKAARRDFLQTAKWPVASHGSANVVAVQHPSLAEPKGTTKVGAPAESTRVGMILGDEMPNFQAGSTIGPISLHELMEGKWFILFSHPADFTPVCTTELSLVAKYMPEFEKRGVKVAAISCDPVEQHVAWSKDVLAQEACKTNKIENLPYPIIADPTRTIATRLGMLDAVSKDAAGLPNSARAVFVVGPDKKLKLSILYPATTGRNFDEVIRVIDSLQLTAQRRLATPGNWKAGEECIVATSVSQEEAPKLFPLGVRTVELPSGKPYLRFTPDPR